MTSKPRGQFVRLAETGRRPITLTIDGVARTALAGDTLLTAILVNGRCVRRSEFGGDGAVAGAPRAGFCVMGACQDCWVSLDDGRRVRACTTFAENGMKVRTAHGG
ncbi:MAG: (2Fe-2S)-binding protein [Alphaproteobacteria bacterium]|nr:(2Fe-2S)-binding protein [Alphaproteobacteria bacterium]